MTAIRALILDFDGVIVESNAIKTEAFAAVFSEYPEHADAMMAHHHAHVSQSRMDKFRHLVVERLGRQADDPLMDELAGAFSRETRQRVIECPLVPGALALLETVSTRVPMYLASVTPQSDLDAIVDARGLTRFFTRLYGCPPWTKASAIVDILAGCGGRDGVVFIGDSAGDQRAAVETGVEFLARDSGLPFDAQAPDAEPDLIAMLARLRPRLPGVSS